jgi:hypothetical protein
MCCRHSPGRRRAAPAACGLHNHQPSQAVNDIRVEWKRYAERRRPECVEALFRQEIETGVRGKISSGLRNR